MRKAEGKYDAWRRKEGGVETLAEAVLRWRWLVARERNASGEPITGIESFTDCLPLQSTTAGPFRLFFSRTQRRRPQMICWTHLPGAALCRAGQAVPHSTPALINNFLVAVCAGEVFTISPYNLGS